MQPGPFSASHNITISETNGTFPFSVTSTNLTYASPGGTFRVAGGSTTVPVYFTLVLFTVEFIENGLPSGSTWSVRISDGPTYTSDSDNLTINETNGTFAYDLGSVNLTYAGPPGSFTVDGQSLIELATFLVQTFPVTFTEAGVPPDVDWSVSVLGQPPTQSTAPSLTLYEPNGSYTYSASRPDLTYTVLTGSFSVRGAPVSVSLTYQRVGFPVIFTESGLSSNALWTVTLAGVSRSGSWKHRVPGGREWDVPVQRVGRLGSHSIPRQWVNLCRRCAGGDRHYFHQQVDRHPVRSAPHRGLSGRRGYRRSGHPSSPRGDRVLTPG